MIGDGIARLRSHRVFEHTGRPIDRDVMEHGGKAFPTLSGSRNEAGISRDESRRTCVRNIFRQQRATRAGKAHGGFNVFQS